MIILDASVLIAFFSNVDVHHTRAVQLLDAHLDDAFAASTITLAEFYAGPARQQQLGTARRLIADLGIAELGLPGDSAWKLGLLRAQTGLRLPDCCVIHTAQEHQPAATVATFDRRLAQEAAALGIRVVDSG